MILPDGIDIGSGHYEFIPALLYGSSSEFQHCRSKFELELQLASNNLRGHIDNFLARTTNGARADSEMTCSQPMDVNFTHCHFTRVVCNSLQQAEHAWAAVIKTWTKSVVPPKLHLINLVVHFLLATRSDQ
jgi:hypothetical protein